MYLTGSAHVKASAVEVVGGYSLVNGGTSTPTPTSGAFAAVDPFSSVPPPTVSSCVSHPDYIQWGQNGHYEIYPGTYCGGLVVSNGVTAHFNPGVYVINGGGIQFGSGSVSGIGVTFYITGSSFTNNQLVTINNGSRVNLSAPTSGTYQGMLFYQDRAINNTALSSSFGGGANMTLSGALYFPTTTLAIDNGATSTANVAMIARTFNLQGGAGVQLSGSTPVLPPIAALVTPASATLYGGQTQQFTAAVANGCTSSVTWSIAPATGAGTISSTGVYTAPATISAMQTVTVTATSQSDTTKTATSAVTLQPPIAVSVTPPTSTLYGGQTQHFTAAVSNTSNTVVTWTVSPASGAGSISASGLYTAPASIAAQQTITVTATSQADSTKKASSIVTLSPPVSVTVTPANATLYQTQTRQFNATVTNAANTTAAWTVSPSSGAGTINSSGLYTAPATIGSQQTATIQATSQADVTKSATSTVTLLPPISVSVNPGMVALNGGQAQQFAATVANTGNTAVTWTMSPSSGAGTISPTGLYTAPATIATQQTVTVTATSQADSTKNTAATVTLRPVSITATPATATLYQTQSQQFSSTVTNTTNTAVNWILTPAGAGTISAAGLYTAPATVTSPQTVTITATSQADTAKTATATVTLVPPVSVTVTPTTATLYQTQTQQFSATVSNVTNTAVTWAITPPTGAGTLSAAGLYSAPATVTTQQTVTVTATSQADSMKTATATVTLTPPVSVTVTPATATLYQTQTQQFSVTVTNATNTAVTWTITPATNAGTISAAGLYTAPANVTTQQTVTVTAASQADTTKTATATVTLQPPVSVTVSPTTATLYQTQTQQFGASVVNATNTAVTWTLNPSTGAGTISAAGLYTAPAAVTAQQTVAVIATSQADTTKSASATVTLTPPVSVTVTPTTTTLYQTQTQQFSASVVDATNTAVTWTLNPSTGAGTISAAGLYTAPAAITAQQTVTVTATSQADTTKTVTATVTLTPPVSVAVTPTTATLYQTQTQSFTATVTNTTNTSVTWTLNPSSGAGTISSVGLYTAPAAVTAQQTVTITATSQADSTKTATATVTLSPPVSVSVTPATATLYQTQTQQFSATVANATNTAVTWTITPATGAGTISATGLYTAPTTVTTQQTVTVTATSQADSTKSATAMVTLSPQTVTVAPVTATLYGAQTQQFTSTIANAGSSAVTWSLNPSGIGTLSTTGLYTAPATIGTQQTVTVTATSHADATQSASATVTLMPPVSVTVTPATAALAPGQTQPFNAAVANATNTAVTWSINPAGTGSITTAGIYTAPPTVTSVQPVTVTATSAADSTKSASVTINLAPLGTVLVSPQTVSLGASQTQQFTGSVANPSNSAVTWSISPAGVGSIDNTGLYTAPACIFGQQIIPVIATSVADATKSAAATVTITNANGFNYQRGITIDHTKVPHTEQSKFPVLISGTYPFLATTANGGRVASANGYDIVFTSDATCLSKLNYQVEQWSAATGQLLAWVQVPSLSHTSDTAVYVCYGNSAITADQSNAAGTWDSNYKAVYHLSNGATLSAIDSSANANNGTATSVNAAVGKIDGAGVSNGGHIDAGNASSLQIAGPITIESWVNTNAIGGSYFRLVSKLSSGPYTGYELLLENGTGRPYIQLANNGSLANAYGSPLTIGAWYHVAGTYDGTTLTTYVNGVAGTPATAPGASGNTSAVLRLFDATFASAPLNGMLDEVRISSSARSGDWIAAEYANQNSPATFYTVSPETTQTINVSPASVTLSLSQTQQFTAALPTGCGSGVTWTLNPAGMGTITTAGLYTAPASITGQQTVTITAASQFDATRTATAIVTLAQSVTVSPTASTLFAGQTQQFTASVTGSTNTSVTWSIAPASAGSISATGLYSAPLCTSAQQTVTITATSVADPTKSATATVTLQPGNGYTYHRLIIVDHTKVPNTDQANFPFLFNTTDPALANTANGGHVASASGYDIIFSTDPNGATKLDHDLDQYNPVTGQVTAWIRIPALSHTADTALYVFYGNAAITAPQENKPGVWDSNYGGVWHFSTPTNLSALDATANTNNGTINGAPTVIAGQFGWAANFAGSSDDIGIRNIPLNGVDYTISAWFKTPLPSTGGYNTLTRGVNSDHQVLIYEGNWHLGTYGNGGAGFADSGFAVNSLPNGWHHLVAVAKGSSTTFYVDGSQVGTIPFKSNSEISFLGNFQGGGQQFGAADEIRVSTGIARSADWIAAEFSNQNSPATFYTLFPETTAIYVTPVTATIYQMQTQQFAAPILANCNSAVTWTLNPAGTGSITPAGLYTAPSTIASQQTVTVTATSQADTTKSAAATLALKPPITVTITPTAATLYGGQTQQFTATVANAVNPAVTWSLNPVGVGTLSASGLYAAPASITTQQTVTITATNQQNTAKLATATVTLMPPVAVTITPTIAILPPGQSQQFTASVANAANTSVTWSLNPAGVGVVTAAGLYTAPSSIPVTQSVSLTATSVFDPTKSASVTFNIAPFGTVVVTPATVTRAPLQTQQFSAAVANPSNTAVTWAISAAGVGTIDNTGLYTAPASICAQQTITVTATSVADTTKTASAVVILSNANGFSYQRTITVDHTKVPNTDQPNFPVLVGGTYPFLAATLNGGHVTNPSGFDIAFTSDPQCRRKLNYEIESWNPVTGQFASWVQIPTLSHTADTVLYVCYGNPAISTDQSTPSAVWDARFGGVWHFPNGSTLTAADSTSNHNDALALNGASAAPGKVGGAASFNGSNYIDFLNLDSLNNYTAMSVSLWMMADHANNSATYGNVLIQKGPTSNFEWNMSLFSYKSTLSVAYVGGGYLETPPVADNQWHKIDFTTDSMFFRRVYVDGVFSSGTQGSIPVDGSGPLRLGGPIGGVASVMNGLVDELRISSIVRSADWIATAYNNENSPATFYTLGTEGAQTLGVSPSNASLYASQSQQFTAALPASCGSAVNWSLTPGVGTLSATGLYIAPSSVATQQTVTITAASLADTTKSASSVVTLLPSESITLSPKVATLYSGESQQFTATIANAANQTVTWSLTSPTAGSIDANGLYTAPASITVQQTITVTATSQADTTRSATASITLSPGQGVPATTTPIGNALGLIGDSICRRPHVAPVVDAGLDQYATLTCPNGQPPCSASATVTGAATNYTLAPGKSLTYAWSLVTGPAAVQFAAANSASSAVMMTAAGTYTLQLAINDGLTTSAGYTHVIVSPVSTSGGNLGLTPAALGPNALNTSVTIQVKFVGFFFGVYNFQGATVNLQITGANPLTSSVVTDTNGVAYFTYTGRNAGPDLITATADTCCYNHWTSNAVPVTWVSDAPRLTSTPVTGRFFAADGTGVFNIPATQQPVFTQVFPNINFNPAPQNLARPFTDAVTDANGNSLGTIPAQGNNNQAGVGPLYSFAAVFTGSLNVPAAGAITFSFTSDDAFVFGVGNGATRVGGPLTNTPANSPFQGYPVMGGINQREAPTMSTVTVNFPAPGVYPYEVDYAKGGDNKLTLSMQSGGVPIPAAALLTLTPNAPPSIQAGGVDTFNVMAADANGVAIENLPLTVNVTGNNAQTRPLTTDGTGQVGFSYAGNPLVGIDQVQATAIVNGQAIYSNVLNVPWNSGTNQAPVVNAGSPQTVTLPSPAILTGSVSDDGLPANTLTITWSMQSGPAPVVFDNPNQAATAATFTTAGVYTLQLSASDGVLTTNSTVTITVNISPNWTAGWLANPLDKSTVSGQVPVTLIPGITLISGTLTYFPAGHPEQVVTITPATTGAGQIAIFDTTLLNNGAYFVLLNATNSQNATQISQAYVTVVGDYKPGRVTATVTDLMVPAPGLPIQIQRTYDSLTRGTVSDFGHGWKLGIRVDLVTSPTGDVTFTLGGRRRTFYFTPPPNALFSYWYTPQYTGEPGLYGSLVNTGDNCTGVLLRVGNIWECAINNAGSVYQATGYLYTDPYGRQYTIAADGSLNSIKDLSNNTVTVTQAGITTSTGLSVPFVRDSAGRIGKITDPLGNAYTYAYDAAGNLSAVTLPGTPAPVTTYTYDTSHLLKGGTDPRNSPLPATNYYPDGKLQSVTDASGNTTSYAYSLTNPTTTTITYPRDAAGNIGTAILVYDSYGMVISQTDPLNHTTTNVYNANHTLQSTTDALGHATSYTYDSNGNQTSVTYPHTATSVNTVSHVAYNQFGLPTSHTDEIGNTQTVTYDSNFHMSTIADTLNGSPSSMATFNYYANGTIQSKAIGYDIVAQPNKATRYLYDQYGNKTAQIDPLNRQTSYTYDTMGRLLSTTPPLPTPSTPPASVTITNQYDELGRMTQVTAPLGKVISYTYDVNGNKLTETDANNHTTSYQYDALNRVTQISYPTTPTTTMTYTYDFRGNVIDATDQSGHVTHNEYDLAGRLVAVTMAFGAPEASRKTMAYDAAGRKTGETSATNQTTTYNYDEAGRLTSTVDAQSHSTTYAYDEAGNGISVTDPDNHTTQYQYDSRRRPFKIIYADSTFTTNTFNGAGKITSVTDPGGKVVNYAYDDAEQLVSVTQANHPDPAHNTTAYAYDPNGNRQSVTDANSHTTTNTFDVLNRQASSTLPAGGATSTNLYDLSGNLQTSTDFNGHTTTYAYDTLNRLISKTPAAALSEPVVSFTYTGTGRRASMTDASGTTTYTYDNRDRVKTKATPQGTVTYAYDAVGNVVSIVSSNANGASMSYTWDTLNRLATVVDNKLSAGQNTTTYTYDPASNLATVTYPNGIQSTFAYDTLNRLTALPITKTSTVASYTYGRGPAGNQLSVTEMSGRQINYTYDGIYRLTNEAISGAPRGQNGAVGYTLDPVGNRTASTSSLLAIAAATYSYDANDRLTSETYDANGNVMASGRRTYAYDFENRIKAVNSGAIAMLYDGDGNRVSKTVGGVTTRYLVDDRNPTGYAQVIDEIVGGAVQRAYTYGVQRISQNQLIASAWTPSFYGYDGHGSVRLLTDTTGTVTDTYDYDAFGNVITSTGSTPNNYLYSGEQFDPDLSLYYLRARYYNPLAGRFLTPDTITGNAMSPIALHKYMYAEADPANKVDPSGQVAEAAQLYSWDVLGSIAVAGAQTLAAACIGGTVLPVLGMGLAYAVGLEVYDVATPFPCFVTFKTRPKAEPLRDPGPLPKPLKWPGNCTPQQLAALNQAKADAEAALMAWGPCRCPKAAAYTRIALLEAFIWARLTVLFTCWGEGDWGHWIAIEDLNQGVLNCTLIARACPF